MSPNHITTDELTDNGHCLVPFPYIVRVFSETGQHIGTDAFRTRSGRDWAARMLTEGTCQLQPHRPLGTRVQPTAAANPHPAAVISRYASVADRRRIARAALTGRGVSA